MRLFLPVATPFAALLLIACQPPAPSAPSALSEADRAALEKISQDFVTAAKAGDWDAVAQTYAEDAILLPPHSPAITGRAAIREHFGALPPVSEMQFHNDEIEGCGDLVYVRGTYSMTLTPEGSDPVQDSGSYLEIRRKQADGSWRISRDMYNSDTPLAE